MQVLFDYILKLSVSLAIVYLFYHLTLRKLTFYNWNRWYLLGYTAIAFLIPLMDITKTLDKNEWTQSVILQYIPVIEVNEGAAINKVATTVWTAFDWLFVILLTGMLVLIVKFAIRYLSFLKVRRGATLLADGNTKLFMVEKDIIPFSFGNNIFINNQLKDEAELKEIIRHEFVHVKQKHTHDIIWSELLCILNWYNPFVWLIRKAIRQNLEFIADNKVLEQGFDKKKYQYLLLKVTGNNHFSIANQFNFSSLKKRIAMMNKMKSARAQLIKFLFIVPLIAVMLLAFRNERNSQKKNSSYSGNLDLTDSVPDAPPPPPPGRPPVPPMPPDAPKLPENVKSLNVEDNKATIILKDGTKEIYDLTSEKDKRVFHQKYGRYLAPPPPPPPPPGHGVSIAPDSEYPITINSVTAPVPARVAVGVNTEVLLSTEANVHGVTGTKVTAPVHAVVSLNEVEVTGYPLKTAVATNVPVAVNVPGSPTFDGLTEVTVGGHNFITGGMEGEKELELKIYKSTSRDKLDQLIAEAKSKDIELKFDNIEYDKSGKLIRLVGKIEKENSKSNFSVTDFQVLTLVVIKNKGKYNCLAWINNQKELQ